MVISPFKPKRIRIKNVKSVSQIANILTTVSIRNKEDCKVKLFNAS